MLNEHQSDFVPGTGSTQQTNRQQKDLWGAAFNPRLTGALDMLWHDHAKFPIGWRAVLARILRQYPRQSKIAMMPIAGKIIMGVVGVKVAITIELKSIEGESMIIYTLQSDLESGRETPNLELLLAWMASEEFAKKLRDE